MDSVTVLDCDWFILEGEKAIKKLAWCSIDTGRSGCLTFDLPKSAYKYARDLQRQATFSHHLPLDERGEFTADDDGEDIIKALNLEEETLYAKGLDKYRFLEKLLRKPVTNLEEFDCPTYENLTTIPRSTLNKAVVFGLWLRNLRSQTSWVLRGSMFHS